MAKLPAPIFGMDKLAHGTISALAVLGGFLVGRRLGFGDLSLFLGVLAAFGLGYAKEAWDAKQGKTFSREDLAADGVGAVLAALMILLGMVV